MPREARTASSPVPACSTPSRGHLRRPREKRSAQLGLRLRGGSDGGQLGCPRERRPREHDAQERAEHALQPRQPPPAEERFCDRVGDQPRLGDDQERLGEPEAPRTVR